MNKKNFVTMMLLTIGLCSCQQKKETGSETGRLTDFVDPFIGTGAHGHTFPGAALPFGMVQLSPDTHLEGWDWCSGYHYTDQSIIGFSHTHLSGSGRSDLMDVMLMPATGDLKLDAGTRENPDDGYRSRFSHNEEWASPGYYKVILKDYDIAAELTVTPRCGFHKYTFPKAKDAHIILDLFHHFATDSVKETSLKILDNQTVTGIRKTKGWGEPGELYWSNQEIYFAVRLSRPFDSSVIYVDNTPLTGEENSATAKNVKALFNYETKKDEVIYIKVGISPVSVENALLNLDTEIPGWDFDKTREQAQQVWEKELNKIRIEASREEKVKFYTSLYHSLLAPFTFSDVNGEYRGFDKKVYTTDKYPAYTVMSLWDTFRAANPLYTLTDPGRVNGIIRSMLNQYDQYGLLPVWPLWASETNCMIGYHAVPVIVDAYLKGIRDYDVEKAYEAMKTSAMQNDFGVNFLKEYGYIPYDKYNKSVATALEYCYDDWCIAQMAKDLGKKDDYEYFMKRAASYAIYFDKEYKLMNGVSSTGKPRRPFDPFYSSYGECDWVEGNSWQYSFFVPHDIQGLINLYGSEKAFVNMLDSLFNLPENISGEDVPVDISGLIGQYVHGNEPSHQVAYLYSYAGAPWKTQEKVHQIMTTLYTTDPDGLCGNEDCGQMSAWYVFSALGFYPVNPTEGIYVFGKPMVDKAEIMLAGNNRFEIVAENLSPENIYIQSICLNGKSYNRLYINHKDIVTGGSLTFVMGAEPNKELGGKQMMVPPSMTKSEREEIYTLTSGDNTMTISASKGGRIISFMNNGKEILLSSDIHDVNYGATLWPSPQKNWGWPPYPVLDTDPYEADYDGQQLMLKSKPDAASGFQFEKQFTVATDASINIRYTIRNISGQEKQVAAWDVCRTDGGISFFPVGEETVLPANTLAGVKVEDGILWYDFDAGVIPKPQKLFSTAKEGWLAHVSDGLLFIKRFPDTNISSLPPEQGEVEIFAQENGQYIELENHGPYTTLKPGEELTYDQTWYLQPINPVVGRMEWVDMVRTQISRQ